MTQLTRREHQVVRLLATGQSQAQIATSLGVAHSTVRSHLNRAYRKLGAANGNQAIAKVLHADPTLIRARDMRRAQAVLRDLIRAADEVIACPEGTVTVLAIEHLEHAVTRARAASTTLTAKRQT